MPGVKIIVGGAVLTPEYAKQIGAGLLRQGRRRKRSLSPKRSLGGNTTETTEHYNVPHAPLGTCGTLKENYARFGR